MLQFTNKIKSIYKINHIIFKREVNSRSLSPKSPKIDKEALDYKTPNIFTKSDDNKNIDTVLNYISDNNTNKELTIRVKRKSPDTLSNEDNVLTKKVKLSHDNDNTSVMDSIESDTSASHVITNPQISEVTNTGPELEAYLANLSNSHENAKNEAFTLIDDVQTTLDLLESYMTEITAQVKEIEESIYVHTRDNDNISLGVPRLISEDSSDNEGSLSDR
jgi:hypothetical protein